MHWYRENRFGQVHLKMDIAKGVVDVGVEAIQDTLNWAVQVLGEFNKYLLKLCLALITWLEKPFCKDVRSKASRSGYNPP